MQAFNPGIQEITLDEFNRFRELIYRHAGISMAPQKRLLVAGRLQKRLRHYRLSTYTDYLGLIEDPHNSEERQILVDFLTTNETYFYREPAHFEFLRQHILPQFRGHTLRVWSAACASGEEVYSLAMTIEDVLGMGDWNVMGSDISERVLEQAMSGIYPLERARDLSPEMLSAYCLKGVRSQSGFLLIEPRIKQRVQFQKINLMQPLPHLQSFDVVFLRNVLIYFDGPTKQKVVQRVVNAVKPGGYLFTSHVESLHGVYDALQMIKPSIFLKPGGRR